MLRENLRSEGTFSFMENIFSIKRLFIMHPRVHHSIKVIPMRMLYSYWKGNQNSLTLQPLHLFAGLGLRLAVISKTKTQYIHSYLHPHG